RRRASERRAAPQGDRAAARGLRRGRCRRARHRPGADGADRVICVHETAPPMSRPTESPMSRPPASQALARFKVLDLTRVRAGPTCVRQLADWGADVIKIEMPEDDGGMGGPRDGPDFQNLHRNKRSMTLDLKSPKGVDIFRELVKRSDVVVENFRP